MRYVRAVINGTGTRDMAGMVQSNGEMRGDMLPGARRAGSDVPPWLNLPEPQSFRPPLKHRTVWISDIHLGTRGCNAEMLVEYLRTIQCETLYLVGDIIDGWQLRKGWHWPAAHNEVVRRILKMAHRGTRVVYVVGNHDEMLRDYAGFSFGGVEIVNEAIHHCRDGRKLLIVHGDAFDSVVLYARWLAVLGDKAYTLLLRLNILLAAIRRMMKLPYWSLSAFAKRKVKNAVEFVGRFEEAVARAALERGLDGVVCGHIHTAEIRQIGDITYYNDGDWVESCTALVEEPDGTFRIIDWAAVKKAEASRGSAAKQSAGREVAA